MADFIATEDNLYTLEGIVKKSHNVLRKPSIKHKEDAREAFNSIYLSGINPLIFEPYSAERALFNSFEGANVGGLKDLTPSLLTLEMYLLGWRAKNKGEITSDIERQIRDYLTRELSALDSYMRLHNQIIEQDLTKYIARFEKLVDRFPFYLPARQKLAEWYHILDTLPEDERITRSIAHSRIFGSFVESGRDKDFSGSFGGYTVEEFVERVSDAMLIYGVETPSALNDILLACSYLEDKVLDQKMESLKNDTISKQGLFGGIYANIMINLMSDIDTWMDSVFRDLIVRGESMDNNDKINYLRNAYSEYSGRVHDLAALSRSLPEKLGEIPVAVREVLFKRNHSLSEQYGSDVSTSLLEATKNVKSLMDAGGKYGERAAAVVCGYDDISHISVAAGKLTGLLDLTERDYKFLEKYVKIEGHPGLIRQALEWFKRNTGDPEERARHYVRVLPLRYERNVVHEHLTQGFIDDVTLDSHTRFDAILGPEMAGLSIDEKATAILERNALALDQGIPFFRNTVLSLFWGGYIFGAREDDFDTMPVWSKRINGGTRHPAYAIISGFPDKGQFFDFIKMYKKAKLAGFEVDLTRFLSDFIRMPQQINTVQVSNYFINVFSFVKGPTLYEQLEEPASVSLRDYAQIIRDLVTIVSQAETFLSSDGKEYKLEEFTLRSRCLNADIRGRLSSSGIPNDLVDKIQRHMMPVYEFMVSEAKGGVYFKDPNPRNIIYAPHRSAHVDFENRGRILAEVNVAKTLRNGLAYKTWENIDYTWAQGDSPGVVGRARQFLASKRYINTFMEDFLVSKYASGLDIPEQKRRIRYDFAALYIHMYYVSLYSEQLKKCSSFALGNSLSITKNRRKYHLLEAKVLIDDMVTHRQGYQLSTEYKEALTELRQDLDGLSNVFRLAA